MTANPSTAMPAISMSVGIGWHGAGDITTTSRVYTHVVADEAELDYAALIA